MLLGFVRPFLVAHLVRSGILLLGFMLRSLNSVFSGAKVISHPAERNR